MPVTAPNGVCGKIARSELPEHGQAGWDYVLIGRKDTTATRDVDQLRDDLSSALSKLHGKRR